MNNEKRVYLRPTKNLEKLGKTNVLEGYELEVEKDPFLDMSGEKPVHTGISVYIKNPDGVLEYIIPISRKHYIEDAEYIDLLTEDTSPKALEICEKMKGKSKLDLAYELDFVKEENAQLKAELRKRMEKKSITRKEVHSFMYMLSHSLLGGLEYGTVAKHDMIERVWDLFELAYDIKE